MAAEMILVPMEQWHRVTKEAKDQPGSSKTENVMSEATPTEAKRQKETSEEYKSLLKELTDLKQGLTSLQRREKGLPQETKGTGKERSRKRKQNIKLPPPGIPHKRTPLIKETKTRDLSRRPPYIKDWSYD